MRQRNAAPTTLAESWDNVGLIAEAPAPRQQRGLFVAIDLTPAVAEELLARDDVGAAVVYHPVIFSPTRKLTCEDPLQRSILRCIAAGISLYCPHTTLDACQGGINDWLMAGVSHAWEDGAPANGALYDAVMAAKYDIVLPNKSDPSVGVGRAGALPQAVSWPTLVSRVKALLRIDSVQVAPAPAQGDGATVQRVAVCAGSGGSVLRERRDVDVWITGEMGHHEVLAANARGISVILTNHTNTERQYLRDVLQRALSSSSYGFPVHVSERDADPLRTM